MMEPTAETVEFWQALEEGRLTARRCRACRTRHHPYPRRICPGCGSREGLSEALGHEGTIVSFTVVERAPHGMTDFPSPYVLALVEIDGFRLLGLIETATPDALDIETRVTFKPVWAGGRALPGFVPAGDQSETP